MLDLKPKLNVHTMRVKMAMLGIYTLAEVATRLGVTRSTLSYWASGISFPSEENLIALATVLECDWKELVIFPKTVALPPTVTLQNNFSAVPA